MQADQAKHLSTSFFVAFRRCMEPRPLAANQMEIPVAPAIVCAAFSTELGFKTLIMQAGGNARGHKLDELFNQLPKPSRNSIVAELRLNEDDFREALRNVSNAFVEWRYVYEQDRIQIDLGFLQRLSEATQHVISG
jgi:hypothetical protein